MSILIGQKAPDFTKSAVLANNEIVGDYSFSQATADKYCLLFFYPLDFTFVCPTELIALNRRLDEFKKRNVEVIAVSIDSAFSHHAWRNKPVAEGGIGEVGYPLVADTDHSIAKAYGVEHPELGVALRAAFMIDRQGIVRAQIVNDLPLGREVDEIIRIFDAIQFYEENGEVCPAGWNKGDIAIKPTTQGIAQYLAERGENL